MRRAGGFPAPTWLLLVSKLFYKVQVVLEDARQQLFGEGEVLAGVDVEP